MKQSKADLIKSYLIIECLDFIDTKDSIHKEKAIGLLKELASYYNISLSKKNRASLKIALRKFIINNEGYITTLCGLYSSL
jgi:hypothetical protein